MGPGFNLAAPSGVKADLGGSANIFFLFPNKKGYLNI